MALQQTNYLLICISLAVASPFENFIDMHKAWFLNSHSLLHVVGQKVNVFNNVFEGDIDAHVRDSLL